MYYARGFANRAVSNNKALGVRLKTLGVHCCEDLPVIGQLLFFPLQSPTEDGTIVTLKF